MTNLEAKYNVALALLKSTLQSYHTLCNILFADRHTGPSWLECDEQTCRLAKRTCETNGIEVK